LTQEHSTQKNPDDIVITLAIRTPLAKGFKGGFKDTNLDFMIYSLMKKVWRGRTKGPGKANIYRSLKNQG
jgi:hypothetical protein